MSMSPGPSISRQASPWLAACAFAAALGAGPALAQDGWQFALSPYVWLPGVSTAVDTGQGTVDVDTSASDAISDLDMALMAAFEARKGKWGLLVDLIYSDLASRASTPLGVLWDKAKVDTRMTALSVYAGYRVIEHDKGWLDVLAGGRFYWLDVDLRLTPGAARGRSFDLDGDWADPLIGLRGRYDFTDRWFATAIGDAGGFGGGSDESWQAIGLLGYQFDERWSIEAGWRYMSVEKELGGRDVAVDLSGPLIGVTARF